MNNNQLIFKSSCWKCKQAQEDPNEQYICPNWKDHWDEAMKLINMNTFNTLKNLIIKFFKLSPCLYVWLNYFSVIREEQQGTLTGWIWLITSFGYFIITLYFTIKNWN